MGARFAAAAGLLLAVAIGFAASDGDGRIVELLVLGAGMILACVAEWRLAALVIVGLPATFLVLESHYGRLDDDHGAGIAFFTLAYAGAGLLAALAGEAFRAWNGTAEAAEAAGGEVTLSGYRRAAPRSSSEPTTIEGAIDAALRSRGLLSLLHVRPDEIDAVAASYGQHATRMLLDRVSDVLRDHLRSTDVLMRHGLFDFWVILPRTHVEAARMTAERIRLAAAEAPVELLEGPLAATVSIGVAASPVDGTESADLVAAAQRALSGAFELGGNRTVLHTLPPGAPRGWGLPAGDSATADVAASPAIVTESSP